MYAKKKLLLTLLGALLLPPSVSGYTVEIPSLQVGGDMFPRSIYSKIKINPGTPGQEETEPSLQIGDDTPVRRSIYSKIEITAGTPAIKETAPSLVIGDDAVRRSVYSRIRVNADNYELESDDPKMETIRYDFGAAPKISLSDYTYVTPAVRGFYTLVSHATPASGEIATRTAAKSGTLQSDATPASGGVTYYFDESPKISLLDHTYITPAVSTTYTLVSNDPANHDHQTYTLGSDAHQIFLATDVKDIPTSVDGLLSEASAPMVYHPATQTLRANWEESHEVSVYDLSGLILQTGRLGGCDRMLSVGTLPAGVYVVIARRNGADALQVLKFIKQ